MANLLKDLPLPTGHLSAPAPPAFSLPPLYAFSYAPALLLFCILLQPSIPAGVSTYGRRFLILPTLVFVTIAPFRWRLSPIEFSVPFNFRLSIFGPDLILKALEWGLMDEKDRTTKLSWVGFEEEKKREEEKEGTTEMEVNEVKGQESPAEGASTAVPADKLKARLKNIEIEAESRTPSSTASSISNSPFSIHNLALGQLPTPQTSPPPTPVDPITAANPPPLDEVKDSTLSNMQLRSTQAKTDQQQRHPMQVLIDACHFLSAMRGNGYAFAQSQAPTKHRSHHRSRAQRLPARAFLRLQAKQFISSQLISTACMAYQVLHRDHRVVPFLVRRFPDLSSPLALSITEHVVNSIAYISVGVSLYCQMQVGYTGAALGIVSASLAVNALLDRYSEIKWRWSFDSREYPPLFDAPFGKMGEGGVSSFWGFRWHSLFKSPFTAVGFNPVMRISRRLGLPKAAGRFIAVYCVFALSAWMHVQAFASARFEATPSPSSQLWAKSLNIPLSSLIPAPWSELSFRERHGTWIFFLSQPIAIAIETFYLAGKKRRIGGLGGRLWTMFWVAGIGAWAVGRSWLALGISHGVPPLELWTWPRYILPTAHLCPAPLFMRL